MSSVWKKPHVSPHLAVVAAPVIVSTEAEAVTADLEREWSDERCRSCRAELAAILENNVLAAAKFRASALEQAARQRAADIIARAQKDAAALKDQAKDEGYRAGYEAGYGTGQNEAEQLKDQAKMLVAEAESERAGLLAEVRPQALELAFAIAARILRREVARSPQTVAELLQAAVDKLPEGEAVTVEVAPGTAAVWTDAKGLVQEVMGDRSYEVVESAHVPTGEFVLSSPVGTVDTRLEPQLQICRQHLLEEDVNAAFEAGSYGL